MTTDAILPSLAVVFGKLSLLSFGGAASVLPEVQREIITVHHWMSAQQFSALYALCQAAPGPNVLVFSMIGWHLAGLSGLLTCALMTYGPTTLITALTLRLWNHYKTHPLRVRIQSGMVPVTAGLVASSAALMADSVALNLPLAGIVAVSAIVAISGRVHPLLILLGGALLGLLC